MAWFIIHFIDGKETRVEAEAYELRDSEWVFRRGEKVVAQYDKEQVRGVAEMSAPDLHPVNLVRPEPPSSDDEPRRYFS
jgi:hypothetical protein